MPLATYKRLDNHSQFRTAMTLVRPNAKGSTVLHPTVSVDLNHPKALQLTVGPSKKQKRVITIRECARAQGFPDDYEFLSVNKNPTHIAEDVSYAVSATSIVKDIFLSFSQKYRQIGNAVPVSLALALGKALGETMITHWRNDESGEEEYGDCGEYPDNERHTSVDL